MKNQFLLDMLCEKAYGAIKEKVGDDTYKEQYYKYISNLYGDFFEEIELEGESEEKINEIVDCYVKIELMCFERIFNYGKE